MGSGSGTKDPAWEEGSLRWEEVEKEGCTPFPTQVCGQALYAFGAGGLVAKIKLLQRKSGGEDADPLAFLSSRLPSAGGQRAEGEFALSWATRFPR